MIEIKKTTHAACCGKTQTVWQINVPLLKEYVKLFEENGFLSIKKSIDSGIFNVENSNMRAICPFGNNKIQIKCKTKLCEEGKCEFEKVLLMIGDLQEK